MERLVPKSKISVGPNLSVNEVIRAGKKFLTDTVDEATQ
jgi:hypothetical protein